MGEMTDDQLREAWRAWRETLRGWEADAPQCAHNQGRGRAARMVVELEAQARRRGLELVPS